MTTVAIISDVEIFKKALILTKSMALWKSSFLVVALVLEMASNARVALAVSGVSTGVNYRCTDHIGLVISFLLISRRYTE